LLLKQLSIEQVWTFLAQDFKKMNIKNNQSVSKGGSESLQEEKKNRISDKITQRAFIRLFEIDKIHVKSNEEIGGTRKGKIKREDN